MEWMLEDWSTWTLHFPVQPYRYGPWTGKSHWGTGLDSKHSLFCWIVLLYILGFFNFLSGFFLIPLGPLTLWLESDFLPSSVWLWHESSIYDTAFNVHSAQPARPLATSPQQEFGVSAPAKLSASLVTLIVGSHLNAIQVFPSKVYLSYKGQPKVPRSWFFFLTQTPTMEHGYKPIFCKIIGIYSSNIMWDFLSLGPHDSYPVTNTTKGHYIFLIFTPTWHFLSPRKTLLEASLIKLW